MFLCLLGLKNQRCKILLTQNRFIWNFKATELFEIFFKDRRRAMHIENQSYDGRVMNPHLLTQTISEKVFEGK